MEVQERRPAQGEDLSREEIDRICYPRTQYAAQIRYLRDVLKLQVERRPDGSPLVWRSHLQAVKGGLSPTMPAPTTGATASRGPKWKVQT